MRPIKLSKRLYVGLQRGLRKLLYFEQRNCVSKGEIKGAMSDVLPWDQSTFFGRLNYYARVTNPRLMFASTTTLDRVEQIVKANK